MEHGNHSRVRACGSEASRAPPRVHGLDVREVPPIIFRYPNCYQVLIYTRRIGRVLNSYLSPFASMASGQHGSGSANKSKNLGDHAHARPRDFWGPTGALSPPRSSRLWLSTRESFSTRMTSCGTARPGPGLKSGSSSAS